MKYLLFEHSLSAHGVGRSSAVIRQIRLRKLSRLSRQSVACDECGAAMVTVDPRHSLAQHLGLRHPEFKHLAQSANKRKPRVACDDCARLFSTKPNLTRHQSLEHGLSTKHRPSRVELKVNCDDCPKTIKKDTIHVHLLFAHSAIRSASRLRALRPRAPTIEASCEDCGRRISHDGLWEHWTAKHGGRRELIRKPRLSKVACDDCAGRTIWRGNYSRHWHSQHRLIIQEICTIRQRREGGVRWK